MAGGNASCGINYFCMGAFLIFVGSVLLCALGFTILLPHAATRNWPEVTCHVTNTTYNFMQCMCDQQIYAEDLGCVIKYPCLEIMIRYSMRASNIPNKTGLNIAKYNLVDDEVTTMIQYAEENVDQWQHRALEGATDTSNVKPETDAKLPEANTIEKSESDTVANLWNLQPEPVSDLSEGRDDLRSTQPYSDSEMTSDGDVITGHTLNSNDDIIWVSTTLFRGWSDAFYGKCSLHECGVEEWNIKAAALFRSSWGTTGQSFPCYYRPDAPGVVILHKTPTSVVMHAILWPCLCLSGGWLLWLGLCIGCCSIDNGENAAI